MTSNKSLEDLQVEVVEVEVQLGWKGEKVIPNRFGESMALLHSEVSEAFEAYRDWGLRDMTPEQRLRPQEGVAQTIVPPKPEGVGSELADVLIRLLSSCDQYGINLEVEYERKMAYNRTRSFRHGGKKL